MNQEKTTAMLQALGQNIDPNDTVTMVLYSTGRNKKVLVDMLINPDIEETIDCLRDTFFGMLQDAFENSEYRINIIRRSILSHNFDQSPFELLYYLIRCASGYGWNFEVIEFSV